MEGILVDVMRKQVIVGGSPVVDLTDADAVLAADPIDVAVALVRTAWTGPRDETVCSNEFILRHAGSLHDSQREMRIRKLATAWQVLERVGAVCHHPEKRGSGFLTELGQTLLESSAAREELSRRLGS